MVDETKTTKSEAEFVYCINMPHVWPIFYPELPEAELAFAEVSAFLERHS